MAYAQRHGHVLMNSPTLRPRITSPPGGPDSPTRGPHVTCGTGTPGRLSLALQAKVQDGPLQRLHVGLLAAKPQSLTQAC